MNTVILKLYILAKQAVKFVTHSKTAGEMPPRDVTQEPTLCGSLGKFFFYFILILVPLGSG